MEEKNILPADVYKTLPDELKAKAGALAKVYSTLFTGEVYERLYAAIREGKTVKEFAQEAQHILDKYGSSEKLKVYTGDRFSPAYADVVFRTNTQAAYAAGRYAEMFSADYMDVAPFWQYQSIDDARTRPEHRALDGKVFRKDDPASRRYLPPSNFNCRCTAVEMTEEEVKASGIKVTRGDDVAALQLHDEDGNPLKDKHGVPLTVGKLPKGWDADRVASLVPDAMKKDTAGVPDALAEPAGGRNRRADRFAVPETSGSTVHYPKASGVKPGRS